MTQGMIWLIRFVRDHQSLKNSPIRSGWNCKRLKAGAYLNGWYFILYLYSVEVGRLQPKETGCSVAGL